MKVADALVALGGAFLAAGLLARVGRRIELPTIPLFMLAGIIFGPHTPGIALFDDAGDLELFAAIGLVLLLFYIGLEFSVEELTSGGRSLLLAGGAYLLLNVGGGLLFGLALGWGTSEALVLAGILGISSSAIVSKLLIELRRISNPETPLILGVIVIEDVFLAVYLALLSPVLGGAGGAGEAAVDIALALGLLLAFIAIARFGAHLVVKLIDAEEDELFIVCFIGLALLTAGLSEELGVKYAIGALMIGIILGSTGARERITHFMHPLRDAFGALFFFAFGLTISPGDIADVIVPVVVAVVLTFALNIAAGVIAARVRDLDREASANIGLTLVARGEFALVLGALGAAAGLDPRITPFVAGYVLILAVLGPLAATRSQALLGLVPGRRVDSASAP
jgi:CPA2 family monovalent cation:H+ antiporter-2